MIVRRLRLQQQSILVGAAVRPTSNLWRLVDLQPELVYADLLDSKQTHATIQSFRPDAIIHAAMFNGHPADAASREACVQISVLGTLHLLEAARAVNSAFVLMGSSLIYAPSEVPLTEDEPIDPISSRGAAKAASLVLFRQLSRLWGLHSCELRVFSAYGPWQQPDRLLPKLLRSARSGEAISVRPGPRHDYVHANDLADACLLALDKIQTLPPAEAFNIGGGVERTNEDTVTAVEEATGRRIHRAEDAYVGTHPSDTEHWCADISKAARVLQWQPRISFLDGLREMYTWQEARRT